MIQKDTALLIIDMQQDFVREGTPLCVAGAAATVPVIASLLADCRNSGRIAIFHIVREYEPDGTDLERCRLESFHRVPGAIRGTAGAEIVPELQPHPGETVIVKPRYSAFFPDQAGFMPAPPWSRFPADSRDAISELHPRHGDRRAFAGLSSHRHFRLLQRPDAGDCGSQPDGYAQSRRPLPDVRRMASGNFRPPSSVILLIRQKPAEGVTFHFPFISSESRALSCTAHQTHCCRNHPHDQLG